MINRHARKLAIGTRGNVGSMEFLSAGALSLEDARTMYIHFLGTHSPLQKLPIVDELRTRSHEA